MPRHSFQKGNQWGKLLKDKKKPPRTEEHKKKISEAMKGKHCSIETIEKRKGKHLSEETKQKISKANKGKHFFSEEAKKKISLARQGEKAYNWKGGITPITGQIKDNNKYRQWRQNILIRDNFTCQKCGIRSGSGHRIYLEAHHKYPFCKLIEEVRNYLPLLSLYEGAMAYTPLWDLGNGITLCRKCHNKTRKRKGG